MKYIYILGFTLITFLFQVKAQTEPFVMTIRLVDSIQGETNSTSFEIPIFDLPQYNYEYAVDWNYNGSFNPDANNINGNITHNYGQHGVFTIAILAENFGSFPSIHFYNSDEGKKVLNVNQWGDNSWRTMRSAFSGCKYFDISATDIPDFSQVVTFSGCFSNCELLKGNSTFNQWDVSTGTSFSNMFYNAKLFNQDIGNWDMSSASGFEGIFQGASSFNQDIGDWDVSSVISFGYAFYEASSFNQDIGSWDVSNSVSFFRTFYKANSFDQDLGNWNVGSSRTFNGMFWGAESFDQDIGTWNVSVGESFAHMFSGANSFNQNISGWDVSSGEDFASMFNLATSFNQDISRWDVSSAYQFVNMFGKAAKFDNNLGGWDISLATNISRMLDSCGLSVENYDSTLIGWASQNIQQNARLGAANLEYCNGEDARNTLISKGWTIVGDRKDCTIDPFVMTIRLVDTIPGETNSTSFTIPTNPDFNTYNYAVDWDYNGTFQADDQNVTGDISNDYGQHGTYQVAIMPEVSDGFPAIYFDNGFGSINEEALKLLLINQWGENRWQTMELAFRGCENMDLEATDLPNFSEVSNYFSMFRSCRSMKGNSPMNAWDVSSGRDFGAIFYDASLFNQDIGAWEVSSGTSFYALFFGAESFNQDIGSWDVSSATFFIWMFNGAKSFNQDIGGWNVSSGTSFWSMFNGAESFNQDIGNWDVSSGTDFSAMFSRALSFNQDIGSWDVSSGTDFGGMFQNANSFNQGIGSWDVSSGTSFERMFKDAIAFNQDLGNWDVSSGVDFRSMLLNAESFNRNIGGWDISSLEQANEMLDSSAISTFNYDATLQGWSAQNVNPDVTLGAASLEYCNSEQARNSLISQGWTIEGDQKDCTSQLFIISIKLVDSIQGSTNSTSFTIPINSSFNTYDYEIDWDYNGTFTIDTNVYGITTHNYGQHGTYQIAIKPNTLNGFPAIQFEFNPDGLKLSSIDQWGDNQWLSMSGAFRGCENMDLIATDVPDFAQVSDFSFMFFGCSSFAGNSSMANWDVCAGTVFSSMFSNATSFNQDIGNWDVSSGTDFRNMFSGATAFNQDIGNWDVSSGLSFGFMFAFSYAFNQDIGNWDVSSGTNFIFMFSSAYAFNQDIGNWNVSSGGEFDGMFLQAYAFNQDIGNWDVSSGIDFNGMFLNATSFNQDISSWNVSSGTNFAGMFMNTTSFNQDIGDWDVGSGNNFNSMFRDATAFNQDIGNWDVSNGKEFRRMFFGATAFNRDIGGWAIDSITSAENMLDSCNISKSNYDATLEGWAAQNVIPNVTLGAAGLEYCDGEDARNTLLAKGWTIVGDEKNCIALTSLVSIVPDKNRYCKSDILTLEADESIPLECDTGGIDRYFFFYSIDNQNTWIPIANSSNSSRINISLDSIDNSSSIDFRCRVEDECNGQLFSDDAVLRIIVEEVMAKQEFLCSRGITNQANNLFELFGLSGGRFISNPAISVDNGGNFDLAATAPQTFFITYESENGCVYDSKFEVSIVDVPEPELSFEDENFCVGDEIGIELLNPQLYSNTINWVFDGNTVGNNVTQLDITPYATDTAATYQGSIELVYENGASCTIQDSFRLFLSPDFNFSIEGLDSCQESIFTVDRDLPNANYSWSSTDTNLDIISPPNGSIVRVEGSGRLSATVDNGCVVENSIIVNTENTSVVAIGPESSRDIRQRLCNGSVLLVFAEDHCGLRWGYNDNENNETVFPIEVLGDVFIGEYLEVSEEEFANRTYFIEVTQCGTGCSAEFVEFRSSSEELYNCQKDKSKLTLYPNPTANQVSLDFEHWAQGTYEWQLQNAVGKLVSSGSFSIQNRHHNLRFNTHQQESGLYYLRVIQSGQLLEIKPVVVLK